MNSASTAEAFVVAFGDFWCAPTPQRLPDLFHDDVRLTQPLAAPVTGIRSAQQQFARFCRCLPGLHAVIDRWSAQDGVVFIEFTLHARLGREALSWPNVNRIILRESKVAERATYFDPLVVLPALARHPSVVWKWLQ